MQQEVHIDYAVGAILDKLDRSVTDKIKQIKDYREQLQEKGDRISKSLLEVQRKVTIACTCYLKPISVHSHILYLVIATYLPLNSLACSLYK